MANLYDVQVDIQWLRDGTAQAFQVKTLAASDDEAAANVRGRFHQAYEVRVKNTKRRR